MDQGYWLREVILRTLITGGAGSIGGDLCRRLCDDGHEMVVLGNLTTGFRANLTALDADFREESQADQSRLIELFPDAESRDLRVSLAETIGWFRAQEAVPG